LSVRRILGARGAHPAPGFPGLDRNFCTKCTRAVRRLIGEAGIPIAIAWGRTTTTPRVYQHERPLCFSLDRPFGGRRAGWVCCSWPTN